MKGGTAQTTQTTSQLKQTTDSHIKKPTAEQIRYAQILGNEDLNVDPNQVKQVAELTGKSIDDVCIALHDCNYDTELTINSLLEGRCNQNEWVISSNRKKKHQGGSTTQGIDNILASKQQKDLPKQSRGSRGGRNRPSSDKPGDSDQRDNHDEDRPPAENGRGRGLRDDRSSSDRRSAPGRGGSNRRGRGGVNRGRSASRGRGGRIGKGGPPVSSQPSSNGPTVNGTEMWDNADLEEETKVKPESWKDTMPTTETWDSEPYISPLPATVKEPVAPTSVSSLFSTVSQSNSWTTDSKDQPWGNSNDSVTTNGNTVMATTREQTNDGSSCTPESVDVAIIHSKLQSPSRQSDHSHSETSMTYISLATSVNHNHLGPISKLLDSVTMASLTQQTPSVSTAQPQRQPKPARSKKSQKSQIPLQAVEMPDSMLDDLDVQLGQLQFGGDFSGSPLKTKAMESAISMPPEDNRAMSQSTVEQEPVSALTSTLSSSLSRSVPVTIASTTSAGSSMTGLDDNSPRHYPHASPREHKTQVPDKPSTPPSSNVSSSLPGVSRSQSLPSASLQSTQLVSSLPKESSLDRTYQHQHVPSQSSLSSKDQLTSTSLGHHSALGGTAISNTQRTDSTNTHPLQPPPGVGVPHTTSQQTSTAMGLTTATVSSSSRPTQHSGKPSLPPGVLPMNTLYGMQQPGMVPGYSIPPFNYEELQRQIHIPQAYYDMSFTGRDNLQGTFQNEQKFGRSDASSPVQTTVNQPQNQHHMQQQQQQQQQAYLNAAATMNHYGYGGLAFYPGGGMIPGGFPTYSPPMFQQMTPKTHVNVSQYQQQAFNSQHGSHNYSSGYDDLSGGHDFNKSPYHTSVTQTQSKANTAVSTSTNLGGEMSYKSQSAKYNDTKAFLSGTPPPLSLGQHNHLGNYGTHNTPFMNMLPTQQHHPHSTLFHHHGMPHQHQDIGQTGIMQRGQQSQLSKQTQSKGGHQGSYPSNFWSNANKS